MSAPTPSMRTPLARVRNLGASHSGTSDFWRQRVTAVAMTLLIVPVIVVVLMVLGRNQAGAAQILGSLPIAIILLLFIVASGLAHEDRHAGGDRGLRAWREAEARLCDGQQFLLHRGSVGLDLRDSQTVIGSLAHGR